MAVTRWSAPTTTSCAMASGSTRTPAASALATCTDASYLAPIGQIGTHDALPQHGGVNHVHRADIHHARRADENVERHLIQRLAVAHEMIRWVNVRAAVRAATQVRDAGDVAPTTWGIIKSRYTTPR